VLDWFELHRFIIDTGLFATLITMSIFVAFNAGVTSLGSIGFMAVGGYSTAILTVDHGWPVPLGIIAGTLMGGAMAFLFGLAVLRLSGIYLALGSFALAQATILLIQASDFTNGVNGIVLIPKRVTTITAVGGLVVLCALLQLIRRSHYGRAMRAIRLDPVVALGLGVNARRYQTFAFVLSGMIASFAGALEAHESTVVAPSQYNFVALTFALTYAMIGGSEFWLGPMVSAGVLITFREWTRSGGTDKQNVAFGLLLVLVVLLIPGGLSDPKLGRAAQWVKGVVTRGRRGQPPDTVEESPGAPVAPSESSVV
jgi:branched-chain amino acid transport system permease protein